LPEAKYSPLNMTGWIILLFVQFCACSCQLPNTVARWEAICVNPDQNSHSASATNCTMTWSQWTTSMSLQYAVVAVSSVRDVVYINRLGTRVFSLESRGSTMTLSELEGHCRCVVCNPGSGQYWLLLLHIMAHWTNIAIEANCFTPGLLYYCRVFEPRSLEARSRKFFDTYV